jgi:multicomponent K+:H+ antiporter subunit G
MIAEIVVSLFILVGAAFTLVGSIGLIRLQDFLSRLHGPTKATTLGAVSYTHLTLPTKA